MAVVSKLSAQQLEPLSPWGKAAAGALGAMLANSAIYPLDLIKTRLQVQIKKTSKTSGSADLEKGTQDESEEESDDYYTSSWDAFKKIYRTKGIKGLYAGLLGSLLGIASMNFAYFYWYSLIRAYYIRRSAKGKSGNGALSTATELSLGAAAGAVAQLLTIPVSVVTTRQQTTTEKKTPSLVECSREIYADDGVTGFWRGMKASLILVVNPSITYGSFERLRAVLFDNKQHLSAGESFMLGAMAKSIATIATQPLIVSKVMTQSKSAAGGKQFNSFVDALVYLFKYEGIFGLFKGLGPQLSKGIVVQGLLFMFKDKIELFLQLLIRAVKLRYGMVRRTTR